MITMRSQHLCSSGGMAALLLHAPIRRQPTPTLSTHMKTSFTKPLVHLLLICFVGAMFLKETSASGASSNLVINGSFESGLSPGWTLDSGSIDEVNGWIAADGTRSIDMTGGDAGKISQLVSGFFPGNSYRVSFFLAGNVGGGPILKTLRVSIGGASQQYTFDITGHGPSNMGWTLQTLDFTATNSTMVLRFESLTDGNAGPALDAVSITTTAPIIAVQPSSQSVLIGDNPIFGATATGNSPFFERCP